MSRHWLAPFTIAACTILTATSATKAVGLTLLSANNQRVDPGSNVLVTYQPQCGCGGGVYYGRNDSFAIDGGAFSRPGPGGNVHCGDIVQNAVVQNPGGSGWTAGAHTVSLWAEVQTVCDNSTYQASKSNEITFWVGDNMPDTMKGPPGSVSTWVGCPIDVATGKMYHQMTDMTIDGPLPIRFTRRYTSTSTDSGPLGYGWQHNYMLKLDELSNPARHTFINEEMRKIPFVCKTYGSSCTEWLESPIDHLTLTFTSGNSQWHVTDKHGKAYDFDTSGNLLSIRDRNENVITLGYDSSGYLTSIADAFGRQITLTNNGSGILQSISAGSRTITYTMTGTDLTKVQYPDINSTNDSFVTYEYSSHKMTSAKDAAGEVIEAHTYTSGRVTHTESEGGTSAYTLAYDTSGDGTAWTTTTVTDSRGNVTTYEIFKPLGNVETRTGPGCSGCGGGTSRFTDYDWNLNLLTIEDGRGLYTHMTYDTHGNMLTATQSDTDGTSHARTTTYTYDSTFNFPATISIPSVGSCSNANKVITNTYASHGNLTQRQITGCNGSSTLANTTTYTYDSHGQPGTVNGPRSGSSDVTTNEYYGDSDGTVNQRARLKKVTDAAGLETSVSGYDIFGNPGSIKDPNNVETAITYDAGGRTTEVRVKGATSSDDIVTQGTYLSVGRLYRVRQPNCVQTGSGCTHTLQYAYVDGVGWLKEVQDSFGNKIVKSYDNAGNLTRLEARDSDGTAKAFTNFFYDEYNRLQYTYYNDTSPEGDNSASVYSKTTYDGDNNTVSERDPEGHTVDSSYDYYNRLISTSQTVGSDTLSTRYLYDSQDNRRCVLDPNVSSGTTDCNSGSSPAVGTTFKHDDLGRVYEEVSPDTGTKTHVYDEAGNPTTSVTARGVTISRTYDGLDRVLSISYSGSTPPDVDYDYDSTGVERGKGRLTSMSDPSGATVYDYDLHGLVKQERKTVGSDTFVIQYVFDKSGQLNSLLYPSNHPSRHQGRADVAYDAATRVSSVQVSLGGTMTTVADTFQYLPFGPRKSMTFGGVHLIDTRSFDSRYLVGTWIVGNTTLGNRINYSHNYNKDWNLIARDDNLDATNQPNDRLYTYDEVHRLIKAKGPWGAGTACTSGCLGGLSSCAYTYDLNGNRKCKGEGSSSPTTYTYTSGTNKLATASSPEAATYTHDNDGDVTGDGTGSGHHTYQYDAADRLVSVDGDSTITASYKFDGYGRRASKTTYGSSGKTTYYFYDPNGLLLTETIPADGTGKDYVYQGMEPLARVDWSPSEASLGNYLLADESGSNVHLSWSGFPGGSADDNLYIIRSNTNPTSKSFSGNSILATQVGTKTYNDSVLSNTNRYDYKVFRRISYDVLSYYHTDHLGTPIAMTDANGSIVWRAEHRPFGDLAPGSPSGSATNNLMFAGQFADAETGLYQNWRRDYSSVIGRYIEPDPIGLAGGDNLYVYAMNNPLSYVDPTGLDVLRCTRPLTIAGSDDPNSFRRHVLLYSTKYKTGCGLGPEKGVCGTLSALVPVPCVGIIELENPLDARGSPKPGYACQTVSKDPKVEECAAKACRGPAPNYSIAGKNACYDWDAGVMQSCENQVKPPPPIRLVRRPPVQPNDDGRHHF